MQSQSETLNYHFGLDGDGNDVIANVNPVNPEAVISQVEPGLNIINASLSATASSVPTLKPLVPEKNEIEEPKPFAPLAFSHREILAGKGRTLKIPETYTPPRKPTVLVSNVQSSENALAKYKTDDSCNKLDEKPAAGSVSATLNRLARVDSANADHTVGPVAPVSPVVSSARVQRASDRRPRDNENNPLALPRVLKISGALIILTLFSVCLFSGYSSAKAYMPTVMKSAGDVAVTLGARSAALKIFDDHLQEPRYVTVLVEWGNKCRAQGRNEDALVYLNRAIALNPLYPLAYLNRGAVYLDLKQGQNAVSDDATAISLNPDYAMAYNNRACSYMSMGKFAPAIADFNKAIQLEPNSVRFWLNRGSCYMSMQQYKQAVQNFDFAIARGNAQATVLKQDALKAMTTTHSSHVRKHHAHKNAQVS